MSKLNEITGSDNIDLYQFIYISRITSIGLSGASTLNDIAKISIQNNEAEGISGILCYGNGYFFQYIEGTEQALTNLKNSLLRDERHKDVQTLDFSAISERRFTSWSLRSIILERWMLKDPKVKALMPFKPYDWNNNQWQQFLDVLQDYYEHQKTAGDSDMQPIKYNALGLTFNRVIGQHKAFFLIQTVLAILIMLALVWLVLADKI